MEKCPAREKLLLLDCNREGKGADLASEPSAEEMIGLLKHATGRGPLRTTTAIASCKAGQRSAGWPEKQHGLFAWLVAQGYSGAADANHDNRVEPTELFSYLQDTMGTAGGQLKVSQTPAIFLPDDRPPRLSEEAKVANRKLAAHIRQDRLKSSEAAEAKNDYIAAAAAVKAGGKEEPEPDLLYGLLFLKSTNRGEAVKWFDSLASRYPDMVLPLQGVAWLRFVERTYQSGVDELAQLVAKIPDPKKPGDPYPEADRQAFYWAGQLREFAALADEEGRRPNADSLAALDAAVGRRGADAQHAYDEGRAKSRDRHDDFTKRIAETANEAVKSKLSLDRHTLSSYVNFPYTQAVQEILTGMDQ